MKKPICPEGALEVPAQTRAHSALSKDGKWKTFPKVPNLLQYISTRTFYGRVKVHSKIYRESLATTVYSVAKQRLPDFIKAKLRKKPLVGGPATFGEARKCYEQDLENDHALSASMKRYRRYCIKKLAGSWPELDSLALNRITETRCKEWAGRLAQALDEQYFNNTLGTLRQILKRAGLAGSDDPSRDIKRLGVKPTALILPEPAQFQKMLETIETSGAGQARSCADLVRFLAYSGCRISEARAAKWTDVNLDRGYITIQTAKRRKTANAALTRNVPIIPEMRSLLDRLAQDRASAQDSICKVGECQNSLNRACRLLQIPRITHHDLRHLFATRCIESGVDIPTVSRWLGHSDGGALAMRVYGHLRDSHSVEMAQKVRFA